MDSEKPHIHIAVKTLVGSRRPLTPHAMQVTGMEINPASYSSDKSVHEETQAILDTAAKKKRGKKKKKSGAGGAESKGTDDA